MILGGTTGNGTGWLGENPSCTSVVGGFGGNAGIEREWLVRNVSSWKGAGGAAKLMGRLLPRMDGFSGHVCTVSEIMEGN